MATCETWAKFAIDNASRIGKPLMSNAGTIHEGTIVLSTESYALITDLSIKIVSKDWLSGDDRELILSKSEFDALCTIEMGA
ncbi:conserved hypothetical protein [Vibrio phage 150E35-1]|nr:conserved hypothetical protein [Vibrio phage 150E35-1]